MTINWKTFLDIPILTKEKLKELAFTYPERDARVIKDDDL